jgi:hypothetical protein
VSDDDARRRERAEPEVRHRRPKIATVGVPIADARCSGEESFVTITALRPISSADPSSGRRTVASTAFGTAARIAAASGESSLHRR